MTKRLALLIAGVVIATLLVAGASALVVGNVRARHTTEVDLREQAVDVATNLHTVLDAGVVGDNPNVLRRRLRLLHAFDRALDLDGLAVVTVQRNGNVVGDDMPAGVTLAMLDLATLRTEAVVSGNNGNLVYAAAATALSDGRLIVTVLTRQANSAIRASQRTFLLAGLLTLALGIAVALILGRRLSRPLRSASAATRGIARGELGTRLPEPPPDRRDELSELARSVNIMATELERNQVLEQQFLLSVSHDLRTPLTSIRGYAEAIGDGAADPQRAAAVIRSEARRLERLVADLLDLAKLRAKGFSLHVERVDLAALASVACDGFRPDAAERDIRIRFVADSPVPVHADHDRLAQVAANLIENALKFARFEVVVAVTIDGGWATLAVDDDGPGIPPADLPHVFDRLYIARASPVRHESSSGLGLAIVKELVEAMGGTVSASRSPQGGAGLVVRLPSIGVGFGQR